MSPPSLPRRRALLLVVAAALLLLWANAPRWSAALEVSSERVSLAIGSGPVRFRTVLSGTGQWLVAVGVGR